MTNDVHIHVVPINDSREHIASPDCWCKPAEDGEYPDIWTHHSMDERKQHEQWMSKK
jgi:hypothetical protein